MWPKSIGELHTVTYMLTFSILETIRISDAQTDAQNVPVDDESPIRKLAEMLM